MKILVVTDGHDCTRLQFASAEGLADVRSRLWATQYTVVGSYESHPLERTSDEMLRVREIMEFVYPPPAPSPSH